MQYSRIWNKVPDNIGERLYLARRYRGLKANDIRIMSDTYYCPFSFTARTIHIFEANKNTDSPECNQYIDWLSKEIAVSKEWIMFGTGKIGTLIDDVDPFQTETFDFKTLSGKQCIQRYFGYSFSDEELIERMLKKCLEYKILNQSIYWKNNVSWYFDNSQKLSSKPQVYEYEWEAEGDLWHQSISFIKKSLWEKSCKNFRLGMTLHDCIRIYMNTIIQIQQDDYRDYIAGYSEFEQLFNSVSKPVFEREPENDNKNTFDFIRISASLPRYRYTKDELKKEVTANIKEIAEYMLEKIEKNRTFKKYGIPINFLKIGKCVITADYMLEFVFELKAID